MLDRPIPIEAPQEATAPPSPPPPARRRWLWPVLWVLGLAGAGVAAVMWRQANPPPPPAAATPAAVPALTISLGPVVTRRLAGTVVGDGSIVAWQELVIGTEVGGLRIVEAPLDEGMPVRAGELLARLDDSVLSAQAAQAQAAIGEAEAFLEFARQEEARSETLVRSQTGSRQVLEQRQSATRQAEARLVSARARLAEVQTRLAQTRILAPTDGLVSRVAVRIGAVPGQGQELFRILRDSRLELEARVPELELADVRAGQPATVRHGNREIAAEVRLVAPVVAAETRLGLVRIALPADSGLRPGMFARAEIHGAAREAVMVPASAIVFRDGAPQAFILPEGGTRVQMRRLVTGVRQDGMVEITEGLQPGERVVTAGAGFLVNGDLVRVAP
ncbi:efflux RND transporter periplasmic adaptor subunit [Roseococcus sp. SDR]|uniref:efflux RND transporter periplasmic adaptor subunit n=1 Tax=Roseococcus sp. SDR TaxID=2835532 RepID=UPI001BD15328|nr:efflux RND transporter periplasmic adaptor subunit [Roseococcus sp. SDR]MBS7788359.1 efflux RND transporter periplasmic adaptor subunit [Roseococcus sp. SDR]MBV1843673.1 efflux RND transporter periplasmic adaptor subunit [Roseococcus sp. SDR]